MSDKREADTGGWKLNSLSSQIRIKSKNLKTQSDMGTIATKFVLGQCSRWKALKEAGHTSYAPD